jgi:hypothetical protein
LPDLEADQVGDGAVSCTQLCAGETCGAELPFFSCSSVCVEHMCV